MSSLAKYDSFFLFLLITIFIPIIAYSISKIVAHVNKRPKKLTSYESCIELTGDAWIQFQIRYYMFALVFVISDVETIFLYPWAMCFNKLGSFAFIEAFIFIFILIIGLVYAWRKGALE
jgi:NAD(P)H-quinone oxidoreductase subunit 3